MTAVLNHRDTTTDPVHVASVGTAENPAAAPDTGTLTVVELRPEQVAQHPDNVRDPGRGITELTRSVAEVGILVPLIVVPVALVPGHDFDPGVTHVAVDGNRRQAAARAAGLPVPCIVRADLAAAKDTARTMAVTGLVRDGLTATEEAHAIARLFELKVSGAAISRATGRSKTHINAARRAATLTGDAATAAADYPLTLDQLAILADWQDEPDAVAALIAAAPRGQLDHTVAQLRTRRAETAALTAVRADLEAAGTTVVDAEPRTWGDTLPRPLRSLRAATADYGDGFSTASHADCPGHAAHLDAYQPDPDDEDQHDDGQDDPDDEDQDDTDDLIDGCPEGGPVEPVNDHGERRRVVDGVHVTITYLCTDPAAHGHLSRYGSAPGPAAPVYTGSDPAEREAAEREAAEQAAAAEEARREARRTLIRRNKESDAAQQVRREFIRASLTVKTRHKAMSAWALERVIRRDLTYSSWTPSAYNPCPVLREILGEDHTTATAQAPASRHGIILWAHVAAAYEAVFNRDSHRDKSPSRAAYLTHLQTLGYTLSDVEQVIIDNATPHLPDSEPGLPADADNPTDAPSPVAGGPGDTQQSAADHQGDAAA